MNKCSFLKVLLVTCLPALTLSCETAEETFVGNRLPLLCDSAYWTCDVLAGCVIDTEHYIEGRFPGVRRILVVTEDPSEVVRGRILLTSFEASGSELLIQLQEPDCTLDTDDSRLYLQDVDLIALAGDDRTIYFELAADLAGEHLLEVYTDAAFSYLLVIDDVGS